MDMIDMIDTKSKRYLYAMHHLIQHDVADVLLKNMLSFTKAHASSMAHLTKTFIHDPSLTAWKCTVILQIGTHVIMIPTITQATNVE